MIMELLCINCQYKDKCFTPDEFKELMEQWDDNCTIDCICYSPDEHNSEKKIKPAHELVNQLIQEEMQKMGWVCRNVFKLKLLWDKIYIWRVTRRKWEKPTLFFRILEFCCNHKLFGAHKKCWAQLVACFMYRPCKIKYREVCDCDLCANEDYSYCGKRESIKEGNKHE